MDAVLFRDDEIAQIIGLPGTGKTATALFVISKLKEKIREENIEDHKLYNFWKNFI